MFKRPAPLTRCVLTNVRPADSRERWPIRGKRSGMMTRPGELLPNPQSLSGDAEADVALALDLAHQIDLPFQIALPSIGRGVGVVGPAPAIVRGVGHRLAAGSERQPGGAPRRGAAVEHADVGEA